jgi:hypothetical protein
MRMTAIAALCTFIVAPVAVHAADGPDLSAVRLELGDLPSGFRVVPDDQLEEAGGSAKQVGEALERSLEKASLHQYVVYASDSGDELIELVLVGPLIAPERIGMSSELADSAAAADDLTPSSSLFVEQSDPRFIDTTGIGDVSVGFAVDGRVTSDSATVTNILGVGWTEATTKLVVAIRGDYVLVMMTQHVGIGGAQVDFLGAARHVDTHLAEALGLAQPGVYRPGGTFSPDIANNIPTIGDLSTEPSVAFANLVLTAVAVIALTVAMRLLNTTLVAHEGALEQLLRPARALGRWWTAADRAIGHRLGARAGIVRVVGVLLFYGVLFSFLQDGWRPWTTSGLFLLAVMTVAFGMVGTTDDMVELRSAHRWGLPARLAVKPALVMFALGSVALTKLAHLVPGLMIGTPEAFSLEDEVDERNELRLARVGLLTTGAVALAAWAIATPLDAELDGTSGALQSVVAAIVTLLVLVFAVAVENLFANLIAFPGSEGATVRRHHPLTWWICIVVVTALFFHTLVNPRGDLARSLESTNVRAVLGTVAGFLVFTAGVRLWFRARVHPDEQPALTGQLVAPATQPSPLPPPITAVANTPPLPTVAPAVLRAARTRRRRDPVVVVKIVVTLVTVLGLTGLIGVVAMQHQRDTKRFETAHEAYLAANCEEATSEYDALLDNSRLIDTAGVTKQAARERAECVELSAIDGIAETDPATALPKYASFVGQHAESVLNESISGRVAEMLRRSDGQEVATETNCDDLDSFQAAGVLPSDQVPQVQLWCALTYEGADRHDDAYSLAVVVLKSAADVAVRASAEDVALRSPGACSDLDRLIGLTSLADGGDGLAVFLQGCMTTATASQDLILLADLQITFLEQYPDHLDAPAVELSLIGNSATCDRLAELQNDVVLAGRAGFIPTIVLTCAQTAETSQDYPAAIERYQWFIDNAPSDERFVTARDGLARSLIAQAAQSSTGSLPAPTATGRSGSDLASVVIYNDSPEELRIVMSGPESRVEVLAASPTSSTYDQVGPLSCRTDVPMLELDVPAGDFQVLVEATGGGIEPFSGTWHLDSRDAYTSCFFIVTSIAVPGG